MCTFRKSCCFCLHTFCRHYPFLRSLGGSRFLQNVATHARECSSSHYRTLVATGLFVSKSTVSPYHWSPLACLLATENRSLMTLVANCVFLSKTTLAPYHCLLATNYRIPITLVATGVFVRNRLPYPHYHCSPLACLLATDYTVAPLSLVATSVFVSNRVP